MLTPFLRVNQFPTSTQSLLPVQIQGFLPRPTSTPLPQQQAPTPASPPWPAAPLPATRSKLAPKAVTIHQASLECTVPLSVITAILVTIAIRQTSTTQADTAILIVPAKMGSLRTLQLADIPAALLPVRQNILPALPKPAPTAAITLHSRLAERAVLQPLIAATLAMPLPAVAPKPAPTAAITLRSRLAERTVLQPLIVATLATPLPAVLRRQPPTKACQHQYRLAERTARSLPLLAAISTTPLPAVQLKLAPTRVTSRPFLPGKPVLNLLLPAVILATRIVNQFITTIIHAHPAIRGKDVTTVNYIKQPTPMAAPAPAAKR